jgi:hypothetical protein
MALEKVNESVLYDCQWTAPAENMLSSCCPRNSRGSEKTESPAETHATVHDFSRYVLRPLYHPCNELSMCRRALDKGMARAVCRSRIYFHETSQLSATTKGRVQAVQPRYCITNLGGWYLLNTGTRHQASFPVDREHISSTEINQDQLTFDWAGHSWSTHGLIRTSSRIMTHFLCYLFGYLFGSRKYSFVQFCSQNVRCLLNSPRVVLTSPTSD